MIVLKHVLEFQSKNYTKSLIVHFLANSRPQMFYHL